MSSPANFNNQRPVIDPSNVAMLLIDHQSGLFQTVGDMPMPELRLRAAALAKMATLAKIPVITTASVPQGPNGPLIPEIHDQVFAVVDASGTYTKMAQEITLARVVQAGVVPMDTGAVASELQKSWNRDDAQQWAEVYTKIFPAYQLLIESYMKAQAVVSNHEVLDSQRK